MIASRRPAARQPPSAATPFAAPPLAALLLAAPLLAAAALRVAGCSPDEEPPQQRHIAARFFEAPPQELWSPAGLTDTEDVLEWRLGEPDEHAAWTVRNADLREEAVGVGLALRGTRRLIQLARPVELEADEIDVFEIELGANRGISIGLEWSSRGQSFSSDRRIYVSSHEVTPGPEGSARLDVGSHRRWQGTIHRLRISLGVPSQRPVLIRRLIAQRTLPDPEALFAATRQGWLVDAGGETRPALLAPPDLEVGREVDIPDAAQLLLGYTAAGEAPGPVQFRVVFVPGDEDRTAEGGPVELLAAEMPPEAGDVWHDAVIDLAALAGRRGRLLLETTTDAAYDPFRHGIPAWSEPQVVAPAGPHDPRPPSAVLISIDTLRADRLSLYGNPRPTSPRLDAWAEERRATVFETAVASAPWTLPAHTTLFTGLDAHRHGINYDFGPPAALEMLAERLRAAGYRTLAVTGGGFLAPQYGLAQGFDRYVHFARREQGSEGELDSGIADALELIAESPDRPFFLFFHTYEVHGPYRERQPHFERLTGYRAPHGVEPAPRGAPPEPAILVDKPLRAIPDPMAGGGPAAPPESAERTLPPPGSPELAALARDLYDSTIAYTDERLGRLFDALEEHGLTDRTAVVFTADHGELLGEHGLAGHDYLYDPNLLIPLVVAPPGAPDPERGAGRRVRQQVRQADVLPTLLELLGLPAPEERLDGRSLVGWMRGELPAAGEAPEPAISYAGRTRRGASLRTADGTKHVRRTTAWAPFAGDTFAFDLTADPGETEPGPGDHRLDRRLREVLARTYPGLLLEIAAGDRGLTVETAGDSISLRGVHSVDADCDCVTLKAEGQARIEVPPGRRIALRLEDPAGTTLEVRTEIPGAGPERRGEATFRVAEPQPQRLEWTGSRWQRHDDGIDRPPSVVLRWRQPPAGEPGGRVSEEDDELREQLRALGYIN